jgi:NTP pyrophosphatase (non-canonical NTP hydrolase)
MPKSLTEMEAEVAEYQVAKGWTDDRSVATSLALLHEEVSEAGHAWREHGLEDMTKGSADKPGGDWRAKPEGVGSELADVFIRLLDTSGRYGLHLPILAASNSAGTFVFSGTFMDNIDTLHNLISLASLSQDDDASTETLANNLYRVLAYVRQLARHHGINLTGEYERKMAYNHLREYRHGGRRV